MYARSYLKRGLGSKIFDVFNVTILLIFTFLVVYPFWNQLVYSFNDGIDSARGGLYFWPRIFSIQSYALLFENDKLLKATVISVLRVLVGTGTCLFCTGLLSYVVSIRHFSGRKFMRLLYLMTMYVSVGVIPYYLLTVRLHMIDTFTVYWLPNIINAYYMLLMASFIQNLPESLFEAARIDGCSEIRIYWKLVVPMSIPVYAAIAVYLSVEHWNSWFDCMIYNPGGNWDTLQVFLRRMLLETQAAGQATNDVFKDRRFSNISPQSMRAATTMVVTIPIALSYPFFQKYFVGGLTIGSVKG